MFDANLDYAEARNPDRCKMLGLVLKPYCEGHRTNLRRISSPFVCGGPVSARDLFLAIMICAQTWEDGELFLARKLSLFSKHLLFAITIVECFLPSFIRKRAEAVWNYIQEAERLPRGIFRSKTHAGEPAKPDGSAATVTYAPKAVCLLDLCNHYHFTQSHVMNMPAREATILRYRLQELDGLLRWRPPYYDTPPQKEEVSNGS